MGTEILSYGTSSSSKMKLTEGNLRSVCEGYPSPTSSGKAVVASKGDSISHFRNERVNVRVNSPEHTKVVAVNYIGLVATTYDNLIVARFTG